MFYICSHFSIRSIGRFWPSLCALVAIVLMGLAGGSAANHGVSHPKVRARVDLMTEQKAALTVLTEMAAQRRAFDRTQARTARKKLRRSTDTILKHFKRAHRDPHSLAKEEIWLNWADFKYHAKQAHNAAEDLKTRSLGNLRRSLPALIDSCHACHTRYKKPAHEFTTH